MPVIPDLATDPRELAAATPQSRLAMLGTSLHGLDTPEAAARLRQFGPNQPIRTTSAHHLGALAAQFTHTLALLLWFAAGLAFAAGLHELGAAIVAVVVLNGAFAFVQEFRAGQVVESLMRRVAVQATARRNGLATTIPAAALVPGDVVQLSAGDIVPADCVLLSAEGLSADLSMLTGETLPVERSADPAVISGSPLHMDGLPPLLPAGAGIATGTATAAVYATGLRSSVALVASLVESAGDRPSLLELQIAALSRVTATVAVLAGAATLVLAAAFTDTSFLTALTFGTGVIVALVPEGLLPTLSVSLAIGARRMADRGAAVRRLSAVEVVGSVTVICTDKTGTLTENALEVKGALSANGASAPSPGMLLAAVLCNDASFNAGFPAGDPLDAALLRWALREGADPERLRAVHPRIDGTPFDARKRYMSVTCDVAGNPRQFVKGAPEAVLRLSDASLPAPLAAAIEEATRAGDRVLLFAAGPPDSPPAPVGLARFSDPPRAGVGAAIQACERAGVRVIMLTGDHPETARAVARTIQLVDGDAPVVTGDAVDQMSDRALSNFLSANAVVARVDPQQKLRIVRVLQAAGEVVVVTGDGVNDAPALRAADVGVAMGLRGTEVAKQAADIVLSDDNFTTIVAAIEEGRSIRANIRRFMSYVFASNVAEMVPFLLYIFLPVPLPLAVIQALAVDVGTDLLPALALGAESPAPGIMRVPPEPPSRPLLTRQLGLRTFLFFGVIEAAVALCGFFAFFAVDGWRPGDSFDPFGDLARQAATVTFLGIVGAQAGCLVAQRDGSLARRLDLRDNRTALLGLGFELVLALVLVYVPGLNRTFSMAALPPAWLLFVPMAALAFIIVDQARRASGAILRRPLPA